MFTESFHRLLKVVYLNNKQNGRVDWLLHILLRIARNLVYEQLQKIEKGKTTHRKSQIHKRHKAAMELHILNPLLQPTNDKHGTDNDCESNKSCNIYKRTVDSSEFNTHEYFSHVLQ